MEECACYKPGRIESSRNRIHVFHRSARVHEYLENNLRGVEDPPAEVQIGLTEGESGNLPIPDDIWPIKSRCMTTQFDRIDLIQALLGGRLDPERGLIHWIELKLDEIRCDRVANLDILSKVRLENRAP